MKLHKKSIPLPLSTSETVKYCSPSITISNIMSRSAINDSHSSSLLFDKQSNKHMINRSFQSSTIVTIPIQTTSTTMLIPRSPIYSKFVGLRDDPPLELPILPNLKTTEKKQKQTEFKQKVDNIILSNLSSIEQNESMNNVKEHIRLAPLASCEVVPDESETINIKQESFNNKQLSVSINNNVNNIDNQYQSNPGITNSLNPNLHNITCNHLDNQLDQCRNVLNQEKHFKLDHVELTKQEGIKTGEQYKHNLLVDISKSDVAISISYENQPTEHFKYPPTEEIDSKNVTKTNEESLDQLTMLTNQQQLSFLHWPSNNLIHSSSNNTNSQYSKLKKSPSSLNYSNDNNRLLESYLNQTIGSSLLAAETNTDRIQSRRSFDKVPEDNIQQQVSLKCQKQLKDTTELLNHTSMKQSTIMLKSSSLTINNTTKYYPVAESLDLATRLTILKKSPKSFTACQSLAKHTMIAALNCSGAFVHLKPTTIIQYPIHQSSNDEHDNHNHTQLKYLDNYLQCKNIMIRSSPSSPNKYSTEICSDIKRQTIRKVNGKEMDHLDENKPSLETINSLSSNNIQRISDIMLKDRKDSLIPQQLGINDCARGSVVSWSGVSNVSKPKRPSVFSCPEAEIESPRSSVINPSLNELASNKRTRPGAVVTSSRRSKRRSSNTAAAQAFAVATAGSANPLAAVGIMGLGPNLFRSSGYRFTAGTATSVASQTGLRSGLIPHSNPSIGNITNSPIINSGSNNSSNVMTTVLINRSQVQNTPNYTYPLSPGISNKVMSLTTMGTSGTVVTTTIMTSSMVSTTPTANTTFRLNLNKSGLNLNTTSTPGTITNTNSTSNNNTFNFHPYNLTSPTLLQSSCLGVGSSTGHCTNQAKRNTMLATASCLRVLNVVRHWITKFPDDFESDPVLKREMQTLLDTLVTCPHLMPNDQKVVNQLLLQMISDQLVQDRIDLDSILTPRQIPSEKNFDQLSALDISEQLTFLDFQIFRSIRSEELLNQSWMKLDKEEKAKHVLLVCKRFNEVSRLVVSEIISRTDLNDRVMCIDKWVAIADICRCMQNYNGVLQICSALVNSSVYRLKRTWERVNKQTKQSIDRLQMLVASDGRFKSMREALHRCDPPCIPYLGMYLTDLSFIEEGALNITENNLVNFCKMRMIAHVIREVQQYHQTPYLITHRQEVTDYLLDPSRLLDEEQTYQASLIIEPRQSINRQSLSGFT
ncbi:unnamed protein product [Schistosoma haematobium]|nr:unnamed protein product [Schistosoma haematobium]